MKDGTTPRPWGVQPVGNGYRILGGPPAHRIVANMPARAEDDAKLIITAVNSHDGLVDACEAALCTLRTGHNKMLTIDVLRGALIKLKEPQ